MANKPTNEELLPSLNVNMSTPVEPKGELVKPEQLMDFYNEILDDIRDDRQEIDKVLSNFLDMVMNEGDSTNASKEAIVNLLKVKAETADKKTKVMDLLMRAFLKERDTFPKYLSAHQTNKINISDNNRKRKLFSSIEDEEKEK